VSNLLEAAPKLVGVLAVVAVARAASAGGSAVLYWTSGSGALQGWQLRVKGGRQVVRATLVHGTKEEGRGTLQIKLTCSSENVLACTG
jgi:hypothetical protein